MSRWPCIVVLALAGCADNAILELSLVHPAAPEGEGQWFARVVVRRGGGGFDTLYAGGDLDVSSVLLGTTTRTDCLSVASEDPTGDVDVWVRYCRNASCTATGDEIGPRRLYHLERPFYRGRRTFFIDARDVIVTCGAETACLVGECVDDRCGCTTADDCCGAGGCDCAGSGPCYTCEGTYCVEQVDRCRIGGCRGSDREDFCEGDMHACELPNAMDINPRTYTCPIP